MSCRHEHDRAGTFVGMITGAIDVALSGGSPNEIVVAAIGGSLGGLAGSRLPDILEPATHPRHRNGFHSVALVSASGWAAFAGMSEWQGTWAGARASATPEKRLLLAFARGLFSGALGGYGSHLALDAGTPLGLPLLPR